MSPVIDLNQVAACCGVVVSTGAEGLLHHGTAWSVGPGEWVTVWSGPEPEVLPRLSLILADDGSLHRLDGWEYDDGLVGLRGPDIGRALPVHPEGAVLRKRDRLCAFGYPDVVDHPSIRLARRELTPELYYPYFCPWTITGHLCLFTSSDGYLTGRFYPGMAGGPVFAADRTVVGLLLGGDYSPEHPPLCRFRRLA